MNADPLTRTLRRLCVVIAALGLAALHDSRAQDPKRPNRSDNRDEPAANEETRGQKKESTVREILKPGVLSAWVKDYVVPEQHRDYLTEIPPASSGEMEVRYRGGRAYYVDRKDWKILRVLDLDRFRKPDAHDAAFAEGSTIPAAQRPRFVAVPVAEEGLVVRYYNGIAYYMDPLFRIVRTLPLVPQ